MKWSRGWLAQRGMVTFELAVGILAACVVTAMLGWGIALLGVQAQCAEVAGQIARQLGRGDSVAAAEAQGRAPEGAQISVSEGAGEIVVVVRLDAYWGALGPVPVQGRAVAPSDGR